MKFGIIYSVDTEEINECDRPPKDQLKELWCRTEEGESELDIEGFRHEKWCACLDLEQFETFLSHTCICASSTETMGSLGAPMPDGGICFGMAPAISFDNDDTDGIYNAYVTPYIEAGDDKLIEGLDTSKGEFNETDWQLVRQWVIDRWA